MINSGILYLLILYVQSINRTSWFSRRSFCMHFGVKKRNFSWPSPRFWWSTYQASDSAKCFIKACVGVYAPSARAFNLAFSFQISWGLNIESSWSKRSPLKIMFALLPLQNSFSISRSTSGSCMASFRCIAEAFDFKGRWLWSEHLMMRIQLPKPVSGSSSLESYINYNIDDKSDDKGWFMSIVAVRGSDVSWLNRISWLYL